MHVAIIVVCILVIVIFQIVIFGKTVKKISSFSGIFPDVADKEFYLSKSGKFTQIYGMRDYKSAQSQLEKLCRDKEQQINDCKDELHNLEYSDYFSEFDSDISVEKQSKLKELKKDLKELEKDLKELEKLQPSELKSYKSRNNVRNIIISSINKYLSNNTSSVSDFNLVKDIVDRNCDAAEDEIQSQLPIPLYCGLMGTMVGIIVGISYLWLSGDLNALLGVQGAAGTGAAGIEALLGGVALAMVSSILGIILTTTGSWEAKSAKSKEESSKHGFLSWMQAELLPVMNQDAASATREMIDNLTKFNVVFEENTEKLNESLNQVAGTTKDQASLLNSINQLKIRDIASANIAVYDKLKNCTTEISGIAEYIGNINEYLNRITDLCNKLDNAEERIHTIEELGIYFKNERTNLDRIQGSMGRAITDLNIFYNDALDNLKKNVEGKSGELSECFTNQSVFLKDMIDGERKLLDDRNSEIDKVIKEIAQLSDVKTLMSQLEKSTNEQNRKMDALLNKLYSKSSSIMPSGVVNGYEVEHHSFLDTVREIPLVYKIISGGLFVWLNVWMVVMLLMGLKII